MAAHAVHLQFFNMIQYQALPGVSVATAGWIFAATPGRLAWPE